MDIHLGDFVTVSRNIVGGTTRDRGKVVRILPDGRLEVRTPNGYAIVGPSEILGHDTSYRPAPKE